MSHYANSVIYFYQNIFDNNIYVGSILFKLSSHKLFFGIAGNKVWGSKIYVNLTQV